MFGDQSETWLINYGNMDEMKVVDDMTCMIYEISFSALDQPSREEHDAAEYIGVVNLKKNAKSMVGRCLHVLGGLRQEYRRVKSERKDSNYWWTAAVDK